MSEKAVDVPKKPTVSKTQRRLTPPLSLKLFVIICLLLILAARVLDFASDHAMANVATLGLGFLAFMSVGCWFVFYSGYTRAWRLGLPAMGFAGMAVFFFFVRIGEVDGELLPSFRWRWAAPRDARLQTPKAEETLADLSKTSKQDFPGYRGQDRRGVVHNVVLKTDWKTDPPKEVWRRDIGAGWSPFSAVNGFAVTLEQRGDEELTTCYEVASGKLVWSHTYPHRHETLLGGIGPRSAPTIHEGRVYVNGSSGVLRCLEGESGKLIWSVDLLEMVGIDVAKDTQMVAWGRASSPLIVDEKVVIPVGGPEGQRFSLAAFDKLTGDLIWKGGDQQVSYSSPVLATLDGVRQIICVNEAVTSGHDVETGSVLWSVEWDGQSNAAANCSQPCIIDDQHVVLTKGYAQGAALLELTKQGDDLAATVVEENRRVLKTKFTSAVVYDGHLFGISDGILECASAMDLKRAWKSRRGRVGHGQLLLVNDKILVQHESGDVSLIEASADDFIEHGKFTALRGKSWNNLCLYGNYLLVRNGKEAACFLLPIEETPAREGDENPAPGTEPTQ